MNTTDQQSPRTVVPGVLWLTFAGIMTLAALLRFYDLELVSVTDETASHLLTASTALSLEGWEWPLAGPPTEPVRSSAFLVTAIAAADVIHWHPLSGFAVVIVLNLCAVALVFNLSRELYGSSSAWIAALLYAVSPWAVLYSRSLLPASCLALFSVWLIGLSLRWLREPSHVRLALMVILALAIPQVHYSGICAPIWLLAVLYFGRKQLSYPSLAIGGLLGAAVWVPWCAYQRMTGWTEFTTWSGEVLLTPEAHGRSLVQSVRHLVEMLHTWGLDAWFGQGPLQSPELFPNWLHWSATAAAVALTGLLLVSIFVNLARSDDRSTQLLLLWIALPLVSGALLRIGENLQNMLIAFPVPFILVSRPLAQLKMKLPRRIQIVPSLAVIAIAAVHIVYLARCAQIVADGRTSPAGRYELSLRQRRDVVRSVIRNAAGRPIELAGLKSGSCPAYQCLLPFQDLSTSARFAEQAQPVYFWIDEEQPSEEIDESGWLVRKERQANQFLSERFRVPPYWVVDERWSVGTSQVYRLHYVEKAPLR